MRVDESSPTIAIDLGSTYSCVGVWQNNWVEIIANEYGSRKTPTCVAFRDGERLVGDAAMNQAAMNTVNTLYGMKRIIGRRFSEPSVQICLEVWPFTVSPGPRELPLITVYDGEEKQFAAEEVCAILLKRLKEIAEDYLKCEVKNCVITVPGSFSSAQREATANAGWIAGLNVFRVVNENTSAACAYALHRESAIAGSETKVLIFDLGGGTLSVSIVTIEEGVVEVKTMAGDSQLGGIDFDRRMMDYFVKEFKEKYGKDISGSARALRKLEMACEKAKRTLSVSSKSMIDIDALFEGIDFVSTITRAKFEELNKDLFARCLEPVKRCLQDAKCSKSDIDRVVLVGGSSRVPKVQEMLQEFFDGKELCKSHVNPDEAVAFGAAVLAAVLGGQASEKLLSFIALEVTPTSLGLETAGGAMTAIISRNTTLPVLREVELCTYPNYQTCVLVEVYEGEEERAVDNDLVAVYELRDLHPSPKGGLEIVVVFDVDASGSLIVKARIKDGEEIKCTRRLLSTPLYPLEIVVA